CGFCPSPPTRPRPSCPDSSPGRMGSESRDAPGRLPADATAKAAPSISMQALTATVPGAILQQVHDWPGEWGKKRLGFEKRRQRRNQPGERILARPEGYFSQE